MPPRLLPMHRTGQTTRRLRAVQSVKNFSRRAVTWRRLDVGSDDQLPPALSLPSCCRFTDAGLKAGERDRPERWEPLLPSATYEPGA